LASSATYSTQHGLKFTALLAEQECKIMLRLGAQSAATQCFASHCAYRRGLAAWLRTKARENNNNKKQSTELR
jgi:hypothetical protein